MNFTHKQKIIYLSHWRFPSEKTMSPLIMKTCEMFAGADFEVELWVPWRHNREFRNVDAFSYHNVEENFIIRRLPALDIMGFLPGMFGFYLLVASFTVSAFLYALLRGLLYSAYFYAHDTRDLLTLLLAKPVAFCEIHDFYKSGIDRVNRFAFTRLTGLIVTNQYKIDRIHEEYGVERERMLHRPNGVDIKKLSSDLSKHAAREKLGLPQEKKVALYTGHLFYWKGVDTLLESARYLPEACVVYFLGGTDEDIENFKEKKEKLGIGPQVVIAGRKPHSEVGLWLKAADILVLPNTAKYAESKYETSPVKLFEYMVSGTPIVASDLPSIRNVVDERTVWFFEPDNPQALASIVSAVLKNTEEAAAKAQCAREEVNKYTWERRTEAIVEFIASRAG